MRLFLPHTPQKHSCLLGIVFFFVFLAPCSAVCPDIDYDNCYKIFSIARIENFKKKKTFFQKFLNLFSADSATSDKEEAFLVADFEMDGACYKMVSKDDISRLKAGGKRKIFGGYRAASLHRTAYADYSDMFKGKHCSYATSYGPGTLGQGINMLRFELYHKKCPVNASDQSITP